MTELKQRSLVVVSAGLSEPSSTRLLADRLSAAAVAAAGDLGVRLTVTVVELRELAHDLMNHLLTGFPPAPLRAALTAVEASDAMIAVTPVFNASYSGLFKSFFDVLGRDALADEPVLIAATGGTARHSLALEHAIRPMFAYLRAVPVPTAVFAAAEDWGAAEGEAAAAGRAAAAGGAVGAGRAAAENGAAAGGRTAAGGWAVAAGGAVAGGRGAVEDWGGSGSGGQLRGRIDRAAAELAREVERRQPAQVADPFALTTSFSELLAGG
jgi:FMN reductase